MIVAIFNAYLVVLFGLVKLRIVPFNLFWKTSPALVLVLLLFGLFIPMGWGAPSGPALVIRPSVAIVADVAGEVIEVPVAANTALKAGEVLFRIDPVPFQSQVDALAAQLKFEELRLAQMTQLERTQAGRAFDVQQREATVEQLKAQIEGARWNLDKTIVRAPADGYVTNLALRKGARVANLPLTPVMAFIDTSETMIGVEVPQIDAASSRRARRSRSPSSSCPARSTRPRWRRCCRRSPRARCSRRASPRRRRRFRPRPSRCASSSTTTTLARRLPAGSVGDAADLHRPYQGQPRHPQGAAAADRDPELRQSVLRREDIMSDHPRIRSVARFEPASAQSAAGLAPRSGAAAWSGFGGSVAAGAGAADAGARGRPQAEHPRHLRRRHRHREHQRLFQRPDGLRDARTSIASAARASSSCTITASSRAPRAARRSSPASTASAPG